MKSLLLGSTAIVCALLSPSLASAACTNTAPVNGETVTCTGTSTAPITGGANTNVTVNLQDKANLNVTTGPGISLGAQGKVNLNGSGAINTTGNIGPGVYAGGVGMTVTLNGTSSITTSGTAAYGVFDTAASGTVVMNDQSRIITTGGDANGIRLDGAGGSLTMNGNSTIATGGNRAYGIQAADDATITLNDGSHIRTSGSLGKGVAVFGNNATVLTSGNASISTSGTVASAIFVNGNDGLVNLSGHTTLSIAGTNSSGVYIRGNNNSVALRDQATITGGTLTYGVYLKGTGNIVTLNEQNTIHVVSGNGVALTGGSNTVVNSGTIISDGAPAIFGDNNVANGDFVINNGLIATNSLDAIVLGAGDDRLVLGHGSHIIGIVDGGTGNDILQLAESGNSDNVFSAFETLIMNGQDWSLSGTSTFSNDIDIQRGRLAINGAVGAPVITVQNAGTLGGNGSLSGNVSSTGTIAPGNSVGTLTINGNFTQSGGRFDTQFDQHGIDKLNIVGHTATLSGAPSLSVTPIGGAAGANGVILHADNGITGSFGAVAFQGNGAATLVQTANDISLTTIDGTAVEGTAFAASQAGLDYLDAVDGELVVDPVTCGDDSCARDAAKKHLWAKAFGHFGSEDASDGNRPFDYRIAGTAMGGDMPVAPGLRLGASFGYSNTDETLTHNAASADINTTQAALYAKYQSGRFFVTGQLSGGWQHLDLSRNLGGNASADAATNGWLFGSSLQAGASFTFPQGWRLTPSLGAAYQHQWVDGYSEHGGGAGDTSIASHQSDALRLRAQLFLSQDYQLSDMTLTPHLKVGAMRQLNLGGHADGSFAIDGSDFSVSLNDTSRTVGLVGLGLQIGFANGLTTYVDYDAALSRQGDVHSITGGLRYDW